MYKGLKLNLYIALLCVFLILTSCQTKAGAMTLSFDPALQEVQIGSPAIVDLYISGLEGHIAIKTFALDILWDPRKLRLNSVEFGNQLNLFGLGSWTSVTPEGIGAVDIYEVSFDSVEDLQNNQLDEFSLATLTFDTILTGTSLLGTSSEVFGMSDGSPCIIDIIEMGRINIVEDNAVSLPASLILLISGLTGLFFLKRV